MNELLLKKAITEVLKTTTFAKIRHRQIDLFFVEGELNAAAFDNSSLILEQRMGIMVTPAVTKLPYLQLKALIAHELAHHLNNDYHPRALPNLLLGLLILTALILGMIGGMTWFWVFITIAWIGNAFVKAMISQKAEYRADQIAARSVGPQAIIDLLSNLKAEEMELVNKILGLWSSHPSAEKRIKKINKNF